MDFDRMDTDMLRQAAKLLDQENRKLREQIAKLAGNEDQLEQLALELHRQLSARNRSLFGDKSEKRSRAKKSDKTKPKTGHGPRPQTELPIAEEVVELDEADRSCPSCGGTLEEWSGQSEDSEEIDVLERRFVRVRRKRMKYRCRCGGCVETAPSPPKLIEGGRYTPAFAVQVAVGKYADHLPLERQVRIMRREGLQIDSQTLWDQIEALAGHLQPAYERLHEYVLSQPVLGADETPWRLMGHKKSGKGSARWYAWALAAPDAVIYRIDESRSAEAASKVLRGFSGTLVCDGYSAYHALQKQGADFRIAHCWAHARRKFVEIEESFPKQCEEVLDLFAKLYAAERELPTGPPEQRLAERKARAGPIVKQIHSWALQTEALPRSPLKKAIDYLGSMWPGLQVFLDDPQVTPDNNAVERALRAVVLGRKNHYGSRSRRGTEVAALFYSLIESAVLAGAEPCAYLERATDAVLRGRTAPLPHELLAQA